MLYILEVVFWWTQLLINLHVFLFSIVIFLELPSIQDLPEVVDSIETSAGREMIKKGLLPFLIYR